MAVTVLADVVGSGGVSWSIGLEVVPLRAPFGGRAGTGGISDETLSFLLEPSSDTLRIMVAEDGLCSFKQGGLDLSDDSMAMYGACTLATRFE